MGTTTAINWCDHTFNPWRGCTKVSPGCDHCYAETNVSCKLHGVAWGPKAERRIKAESGWKEPLTWNRAAERDGVRRKVFCGSLMDFFEYRPELAEPRLGTQQLVTATPWLDWLFLTKRPDNALYMASTLFWQQHPNAWLGVTVENQEMADKRSPALLEIPAAVRFVSYEPALGEVDWIPWLAQNHIWKADQHQLKTAHIVQHHPCKSVCLDCSQEFLDSEQTIDWLILGCESGPRRRPCDNDWIADTLIQCAAAGVPAFVKQVEINGRVSHDPKEWPKHLRTRQFPR